MEASHMQVVGRREGRTIKTEQWVQVISQISHRQHRSNRWEMRQWDNETVETWDIQFWTRRYWMYRVIGEPWWAVVLVGFSVLALPEHSAVDFVGEGSVQPETDWLWWFDWWEIQCIYCTKGEMISFRDPVLLHMATLWCKICCWLQNSYNTEQKQKMQRKYKKYKISITCGIGPLDRN